METDPHGLATDLGSSPDFVFVFSVYLKHPPGAKKADSPFLSWPVLLVGWAVGRQAGVGFRPLGTWGRVCARPLLPRPSSSFQAQPFPS